MTAPLSTTISMAVLALVGVRLFGGLRRSLANDGRALIVSIVRGIRWRHIWPVPLVLTSVLAAATALTRIPGLQWGWWTALGGEGNPVFGSNTSTRGTVWEWLIPAVFVVMLLPALPLFAYAEERLFRSHAEEWSANRRALKIVEFGLIHALIGIPLGVALALSVGGGYFMYAYLRAYRLHRSTTQATLESARAHTAYNGLIVGVVLVTLTVQVFT